MPQFLQDFFSEASITILVIIFLAVLIIRIWNRSYETEKKETLPAFALNTLKYILKFQFGFFVFYFLGATGIFEFLQYTVYLIGILFVLIYPILAIMNGGDL